MKPFRPPRPPLPDPEPPPLDLSRHSFDHPVWISPDWPPPSELALLIRQIRTHPSQYAIARLAQFGQRWDHHHLCLVGSYCDLTPVLEAERQLYGWNRPLP